MEGGRKGSKGRREEGAEGRQGLNWRRGLSDESAPENVDLSNTCFGYVWGGAGVGAVIGGTSARLGDGEWTFSGQQILLCAFPGKGL